MRSAGVRFAVASRARELLLGSLSGFAVMERVECVFDSCVPDWYLVSRVRIFPPGHGPGVMSWDRQSSQVVLQGVRGDYLVTVELCAPDSAPPSCTGRSVYFFCGSGVSCLFCGCSESFVSLFVPCVCLPWISCLGQHVRYIELDWGGLHQGLIGSSLP